MGIDEFNESEILSTWQQNAKPWMTAIDKQQVESRRLVTDAAIVSAVLEQSPNTVIDIGCGEGWLVRRLVAKGIEAIGVDAVQALVDSARQQGGGDYRVLNYSDISATDFSVKADVVVCNFSLLGKASVEAVFSAVKALLSERGVFIVQTLHPEYVDDGNSTVDGWRVGSWSGFSDQFVNPAPWYFRTLSSWAALFERYGYSLLGRQEPLHPNTGKPASVIFIAGNNT